MLDVGDVRHAVHQLGDVGGSAGGFEFAAAVELVGERYQIDSLLSLAQRNHLLVDAPVMIVEEILGLEDFDGRIQRVVVDKNRAENAACRPVDINKLVDMMEKLSNLRWRSILSRSGRDKYLRAHNPPSADERK